ncbi:MAG: tRNA (adenosine(37)-N6)-threonylcarbamoyltransferase complex ATPase subunit type 1 TsaE [Tepidisphaeraceae bacterium]|jgi:tRNA threonylcarbamoyladenosine biosynthesis protein TsaE
MIPPHRLPARLSHSVAETEAIAGELAIQLSPGDCVALYGDLGAGKTQFVRGLVRALGGNPRAVSSPTYVLLNIYPTPKLAVYHLDAYRVHGSEDFDAIGFPELLEQGGLVVIEWPARVESLLPDSRVNVSLVSTSPRTRKITITHIPPL